LSALKAFSLPALAPRVQERAAGLFSRCARCGRCFSTLKKAQTLHFQCFKLSTALKVSRCEFSKQLHRTPARLNQANLLSRWCKLPRGHCGLCESKSICMQIGHGPIHLGRYAHSDK